MSNRRSKVRSHALSVLIGVLAVAFLASCSRPGGNVFTIQISQASRLRAVDIIHALVKADVAECVHAHKDRMPTDVDFTCLQSEKLDEHVYENAVCIFENNAPRTEIAVSVFYVSKAGESAPHGLKHYVPEKFYQNAKDRRDTIVRLLREKKIEILAISDEPDDDVAKKCIH